MAEKTYTYQYGNAGKTDKKIQVNDIRIIATDRTKKSIEGWRNAHRAGEVVVNPNRARLYDIYDDVTLDGHLSGIIQKRIDAVLNKEIVFNNSDGSRNKDMDNLIRAAAFRTIVRTVMETVLWGISGIEFIPGKELAFELIPRKHIKPELGIISLEQNSIDGFPYTDQESIRILGEPRDLGLLLKCAPYAIYKRDTIADWANYIEIFGQPVRVIKYDAYDQQTKIELKEVLDESGSSLALMIPKQADFEMKDGKQSNGTGELQESFKDSLNAEMSIIILGNTETTTNGKTGSQAKSKVHSDQQNEIAKSDLIYTANMLNDPRLIKNLKAAGWPVTESGRFAFTKEIDINFLKDRIEVDKVIAEFADIPQQYWYDTYGIPKPTAAETETIKKEKKQSKKPSAPADQEDEDNLNYSKTGRLRNLLNALKYFFD